MPREAKRPKRRYQSIVRAVYGTPWVIREDKLDAIRHFLARRSAGDALSREEIAAAMSGRPQPVAVKDTPESKKVALINVLGVVCQRMSLMEEISGGCSTEAVGRAFDKAIADGNVGTVILNIDSPGGSIFGVQELAEKIYAARGKKRVIAIANSEAASAAFWIASAAGEFFVTPGGWVGSIGALMVHYSTEGWEVKEGYETTITREPEGKAEGAAGESLTQAAKAHRQQLVTDVYDKFVAAVAKHRNVSVKTVASSYGQGRMLMAEDAKAAGMVDRLVTLEQLLSELGVTAKAQSASASEPAFPLEGLNMNPKIFGALVRIGMCQITATNEEASAALARFFAAKGLDLPPKEDDQLAALDAHIKAIGTSPATPAPAPAPAPAAATPATSPAAADGDRATDIMAAVRMSQVPQDRQLELANELISARDNGQPLTLQAAVRRIQKAASDHSAATAPGATVITGGAAERDKFRIAARDAILQRSLVGAMPKQIFDAGQQAYVEWKPVAGGPRNLLGIAQQCLVLGGVPAMRVLNLAPVQIARLVMGEKPENLGLSSLFASSDGAGFNVSGMFSNILFDAANVSLRRSYDDGRSTYQQWCRKGQDIPDFKDVHRIIAGEFGDPKAIPEDGEFEETTLTDGKEKYRLTVWGEIFSHSWQLIVNDQLGSFMEAPQKMGNAMRRKTNRLAYQVLKDNAALADAVALFHASAVPTGHNNITTGALATAADFIGAWNTMNQKMREQKGLSTESAALNIPPRYVLIPPARHGVVYTALGSLSVTTSGNAGEVNIWKGVLEPVEDAELGAGSTGGSDVIHYVAADPADVDTVEYATLEGMPAPVIEQETAFQQLAIKRRIYFAFGIKALDFRGLQRHNGA